MHRTIEVLLALLLAGACAGGEDGVLTPIEAVINAARGDDASGLADLCDPEGHADSDARRVCAESPTRAREWALFKAWFADAQILGLLPSTGPDEMRVAVAIGPDHRRVEVTVVRRSARWYLLRL